MRIEVSQLPPSEYSPNWRGFWAVRYNAGQVYKEAVFFACVDARNREVLSLKWEPFNRARLDLTFVFPQRRRRDRDNILSRAKPGIDAIVDAGLIIDDDAEHLEIGKVDILVEIERAPLTVIEITRLE
jgi:Holliday junction resolvase RusA-like endonuclease